MPRRHNPKALAATLDRTVTKPDDNAPPVAPEDRPESAPAPDPVDAAAPPADEPAVPSEDTPAAAAAVPVDPDARVRRTVVRVPQDLRRRLERHARRTGLPYTQVVLDAYRDHVAELAAADAAATDGDPLALPARPDYIADGRRRRGSVGAVDLPLLLYPAERAVLDRAVDAGRARTLSDLVTRVLELALPTRRRG